MASAEERVVQLERENEELRATVRDLQHELRRMRTHFSTASTRAEASLHSLLQMLPQTHQTQHALRATQQQLAETTAVELDYAHAQHEHVAAEHARQQARLDEQASRLSQQREEVDAMLRQQQARHSSAEQQRSSSRARAADSEQEVRLAAMRMESPPADNGAPETAAPAAAATETLVIDVDASSPPRRPLIATTVAAASSPAASAEIPMPRQALVPQRRDQQDLAEPESPSPPSAASMDSASVTAAVAAGGALAYAESTPHLVHMLQQQKQMRLQQREREAAAAAVRTRLFSSAALPASPDENARRASAAAESTPAQAKTPLQSLAQALEIDSALRPLLRNMTAAEQQAAKPQQKPLAAPSTPLNQRATKPVNLDSI